MKYKLFGITIFEKTPESQEQRALSVSQLEKIFGDKSYLGYYINENSASTISAVYACTRICAESIAMLPVNVFYRDNNGRRIATELKVNYLLHSRPNNFMNSFTFREVMQAHVELWGNAYAIIRRDVNGIINSFELIPHPSLVTPFMFKNELYYNIKGIDLPIPSRDMLHIRGLGYDGLEGKGVITVARETISSALAMQEYATKVFSSGSSKRLAIKVPGKLDDSTYQRLKKDFAEKYSGISNLQEVAILEGGMDFVAVGLHPADAQFIEQRKFSVIEIARFFRIPPHKIQSMEASTNNNIEHQAIEFVTDTIMPRVARWEYELNNKLFNDKNYYVKFNLNALMRGDMASRGEWYTKMLNFGIYNANEIRDLEDVDPRPGGDVYLTPANLISDKQREKIEMPDALPK